MKFGRNFAWHQVPKWAGFYVNYDEWKVLAKAEKFAGLRRAITCDTRMIETFLQDKFQAVVQQLSILEDEYNLTLDSWDTVALQSIPTYEKNDITASLTEVASLVILLSRYVSATQVAAERISSKTAETLDEVDHLRTILQKATAQWVQNLQRINSLLRILHLKKPSDERDTSSLLLANLQAGQNPQVLEKAARALQQDSPEQLKEFLQDESIKESNSSNQKIILILTKIGILCSASKCLPLLVSHLSIDHGLGNYGSQNPIHLQILQAAWLKDADLAHQGVRLILETLPPLHWPDLLLCPDSLGRVALHYAACYGLTATCNEILEHVSSLDVPEATDSPPVFLLSDNLGETPLSMAITQGHDQVVKCFLNWTHQSGGQVSPPGANKLEGVFYDMILLAIRSQRPHITEFLMDHNPQLLTTCSTISELLCLASQFGQASIVGRLLAHSNNINIGQRLRGRTPLMIASIYEHGDVVELLIQHPSCDISVRDHDGWTAVAHAAFKGPPALVDVLQSQSAGLSAHLGPTNHQESIKLPAHSPKRQNQASKNVALGRHQQDCSHIFVNLGHFDMEKESMVLQIEPFRRLISPMQIPESSLTLEISAIDSSTAEKYHFPFPIFQDLSNDPMHFMAKDPNAVKFMFRVYCSVVGHNTHEQRGQLIGSASVSLGDARKALGPSLESLERDHTVSLISPDAFGNEYIGTLTFTFVIAEAFVFKGSPPKPTEMILKQDDSPLVAGHRGLGQNSSNQARLQLGENTMDSFFAALNAGADILEPSGFLQKVDVQVTRDLIPVIYHDFLVSETGTDAPMHNITYEQLMVASTMQDSTARPPGTASSLLQRAEVNAMQRPRAYSAGKARPDNIDIVARLMSTFNFQNFGFKGNIGGECIHGPFMKLEQLLVEMDSSICFNIELKYPMLFEARDFDMDTLAMELNLYLDTILDIVFKHGKNRPIFFSSFSPELCFVLSTKQKLYPILFLTESGYIPTRDIRAISFQEAVRFAKKWNLEGVAIRSQPFLAAPELIGLVKSSGLICASWGDLNDEPDCAKSGSVSEQSNLLQACIEDGFFYLDFTQSSHSKVLDEVESVFNLSKDLFDYPLDIKTLFDVDRISDLKVNGYKPKGRNIVNKSGKSDGFESWVLPRNGLLQLSEDPFPYPPVIAKSIGHLRSLIKGINSAAHVILSSLSSSLSLPEGQRLEDFQGLSRPSPDILRLLRYHADPDASCVPQTPHTDLGSLTFVFSTTPGLQVLPAGVANRDGDDDATGPSPWRYVAPRPGHAVVNIGDCLSIMTNGLLKTALHRVGPVHGHPMPERYSLAYLMRPEDDTVLRVLDSPHIPRPETSRADDEVTSGEWIRRKFKALRGQQNGGNIDRVLTGGRGVLI
ncbi:hypothetical protein PFICI_00337 [Pestalotiopsis fici W106-1]|uniref:Fe2OG dioxygenase domain-containing protein n=1 Tax=Pestalotiopsis fici (strain W106-1 / CGMCC3.15140) TaxID=1229662 RepID=W3XKG6_PESFW|nr:uncharacterized protein PFICI_00337 [Pestalotiopsis fici W106-1]ETS86509.1 hypothetical protein PFICI_00337 [Pestalotiopsis fici W106-1]